MRRKTVLLCVLLIVALAASIGAYYYFAYARSNNKITEGTLVRGIERMVGEIKL